MQQHLQGKTLLVTGGGGSIGSELCKQLARLQPQQLIVFDQCEFNLYKINAELQRLFPQLNHHAVLGSVTDAACVERLLTQFQPAIIFHAAAYKHVPLLEYQVRQALQNNVVGTLTLAKAAIAAGVGRMVLISTDKAVNPANVMGASKRAAERVCQALHQQGQTQFMTVRFGNVLDSAGSVVPLFRQQIAAGGPVTVTHPDITRYFMTIPEACQLIMQAQTVGKGGEVFVLDMGEPIKISYLAEQMIRLSGQSVVIEYVGLRPGEKLFEELFHADEALLETGYSKLRLAKARSDASETVLQAVEQLVSACQYADEAELMRQLKQLVPEFVAS
jgi:FlaA1/EpsC-like NDP-sugar epimerase